MTSDLKSRMAEALEASGKSKSELARFCGVSQPSVTAWLNGKTKSLDAGSALKASMFLVVSARARARGRERNYLFFICSLSVMGALNAR